ncbi:Glycoside hydrolase superfamily [Penicillium crustosum]|uniref:Glycoside hydrolase superfamily n=1 Tax=Penicillium crustosum TaxID=36656 RepID=UPI002395ABFA|nr:Glycoside hydrolase superfamily [Penicillium crustosum]KAJ5394429.1 Glycoside hydrolase superfamily [Penicillium crustosum]
MSAALLRTWLLKPEVSTLDRCPPSFQLDTHHLDHGSVKISKGVKTISSTRLKVFADFCWSMLRSSTLPLDTLALGILEYIYHSLGDSLC